MSWQGQLQEGLGLRGQLGFYVAWQHAVRSRIQTKGGAILSCQHVLPCLHQPCYQGCLQTQLLISSTHASDLHASR